ncbi:hypothetical protein pdam_00024219 [Pocillopora damicornis]|uniref:THAP-type domain-containing protein n=1 Tax=Pocillopora damicornis TaxID=46731 RepID=A0A3M6UTE4_POCDA|nr:hypothetical protein pdam_00024219 [Pocillopora damicornis]
MAELECFPINTVRAFLREHGFKEMKDEWNCQFGIVLGWSKQATSKKNENLRFHRFPKKRELKDQWIAKIRRDKGDYFAVTENTRVCSKHFCEEDYKVSEDGKGNKIVLKKDHFAVCR